MVFRFGDVHGSTSIYSSASIGSNTFVTWGQALSSMRGNCRPTASASSRTTAECMLSTHACELRTSYTKTRSVLHPTIASPQTIDSTSITVDFLGISKSFKICRLSPYSQSILIAINKQDNCSCDHYPRISAPLMRACRFPLLTGSRRSGRQKCNPDSQNLFRMVWKVPTGFGHVTTKKQAQII